MLKYIDLHGTDVYYDLQKVISAADTGRKAGQQIPAAILERGWPFGFLGQ